MEYGKVGFGDAPGESLLLLPGGFSLLAVLTQSRNGVAGIFCGLGVRLPKHIDGKLQFPDFADGHIGGIGNRIRRMLLFGNVGVGLFNGFKTPGKGEKQFSSLFDIWVIVSEFFAGLVQPFEGRFGINEFVPEIPEDARRRVPTCRATGKGRETT